MAAPLELEDYYDLTTITEQAVSPSGDRVAFVASEFDPDEDRRRNSLFVVPTVGGGDPHRLTRASDASQPTWSPDGRKLGFVAARDEDVARTVGRDEENEAADEEEQADEEGDGEAPAGPPGGDEGPKPQVWAFDLELGGDAIQVTDADEGVSAFDWGPDGERVVFGARDPTDEQQEALEERRDDGPIEVERLQHKANGVGFTDEVRTYAFVTDVDGGEPERLNDVYASGARAPLFDLQLSWGPAGRIAFATNLTENPDDSGAMHLYTVAPDGSDRRQITDGEFQSMWFEWSPDGDRIAFVGSDPNNWYEPSEYYVAEDEPGAYESVSASLDRTPAMASSPVWVDGDTILGAVGDEGWTRLVRVDANGDGPERVFGAQGRDRTIGFGGMDLGGDRVVVHLSDPSSGTDLHALSVADLEADEDRSERLTATNDELIEGAETPRTRRVTWENDDGVEIEGIAYLPADFEADDDPRPVIASIHGGPMAYDAPQFSFDFSYWTGQGYVVYRTNYRGSTSYGKEFAERLMGIRGDLETDDVVSGLEELADRGWVDPDRSFVTGFSYGGITTGNVVTMEEDPFTAAAAEHGIYDFTSTFGTDDNHLWHDWEFGLPWEEPETYEDISSITDVGNVDTPLLVTAGENDWRCPPTQAEQFYVSVKKQGVPAKLVIYQDEHHDIGDPDRAIHRLETLTEWFERHDPANEGADGHGDDEGDPEDAT
jgi:dipeptidyl aminopeptidase/acylaminoacyl peptidase